MMSIEMSNIVRLRRSGARVELNKTDSSYASSSVLRRILVSFSVAVGFGVELEVGFGRLHMLLPL